MEIEKQYSIDEFEKIFWNGYQYTIDNDTLNIIQSLADKVGAPNYVKTPVFTKNIHNKKKKDKTTFFEEDWEAVRNFKSTTIEKKEGIDKKIEEMRILLNKITEKNYDNIKDQIIEILNSCNENEFTDIEIDKILKYVFNTASSNKFYSTTYAKLIVDLLDKFNNIKVLFNNNKHNYMNQFDNIVYCDPDEDYDKFCDNNLVNEHRRASSLFLVNLMKLNVIVPQEIINLISNLQEMISQNILKTNNTQIGEEITENLYILVCNSYSLIKKNNDWLNCYKEIKDISQLKAKSKPSLSHKMIFKHMDILDNIKKQIF